MSGIVDPSTPERAAREEIDTHLAELRLTHPYRAELLDAYAAAVRARALADVAGWVEGMQTVHTAECVKAAEEFLYEPLDRVCSCFATAHNQALDALLAKLREAK